MVEFPKPGPEHQRLRRLTGAWTARFQYFASPGAPPVESNGEFLARMDLGGYFLCREVNFGMQGYQGRGLTGYDPFRKMYVGTWLDSTSPCIYQCEGDFDERGNYREHSSGPGPDGRIVRSRMTTELLDQNHVLFRMYRVPEAGDETLVLQIEHTRRRFVD